MSYLLFYGYLSITSLKALILGLQKKNYAKKERYLTLVSFLIFPILFGILQMLIEGIPFLPVGISLGILVAYTATQEQMISLDFLTQINNRTEMLNFLSNKMKEKNANIAVYMLDIDNFKRINDLYGHLEGDYLLTRVANSLKVFAAKYGVFISRYAGDEFIVIFDNKNILSEEEFSNEINHILLLENEKSTTPYNVNISVGMHICQKDDSIPAIIEQADRALYKNKNNNRDNF